MKNNIPYIIYKIVILVLTIIIALSVDIILKVIGVSEIIRVAIISITGFLINETTSKERRE